MKLNPVNGLPEKVTHREYLKAGQKALEEFKKIPDAVVGVTFTKEGLFEFLLGRLYDGPDHRARLPERGCPYGRW